MSEYQFVIFRAIDGPVSKDNLKYMHRQSSRAEISPWSFINEYHYGDFGGDALEMLRRGYDIHLHYSNFGYRNLFIRLPRGLPNPTAAAPYFLEESLHFVEDKEGSGGTLAIAPFFESGTLDELWEIPDLLERLLPLRGELLDGDLRPLYLAHLAVALDGNHDPAEEIEGPVPSGLSELSDAQRALAEFYGISDSLIAAAAQKSPPASPTADATIAYAAWLQRQEPTKKDQWLLELMSNPTSGVRSELLANFRDSRDLPAWPTVKADRSIAELDAAADELARVAAEKAAAAAARKRKKRLTDMAADPLPTLRETERLVTERTTDAYEKIAKLLADLREALAGSAEIELVEKQAHKLKAANPTLKHLVGALRRQGFLPK